MEKTKREKFLESKLKFYLEHPKAGNSIKASPYMSELSRIRKRKSK